MHMICNVKFHHKFDVKYIKKLLWINSCVSMKSITYVRWIVQYDVLYVQGENP